MRVDSMTWHGPPEFMRPLDHDERIRQMERNAQWHLGSSSWAAHLFTAYEHPAEAHRALEADKNGLVE